MTVRELADPGYYGFEDLLTFEGADPADRVLSALEREDTMAEKYISCGLFAFTGIYLLGSIIRVIV